MGPWAWDRPQRIGMLVGVGPSEIDDLAAFPGGRHSESPEGRPFPAPESSEAPGGPGLALGPLASLAEVLRTDEGAQGGVGTGRGRAERFLDHMARDLEARGLAWVPPRGEPRIGGRLRASELDLGLAGRLEPGEVLDLGLALGRRSARAQATGGWQLLVRTCQGVPGVLVVVAPVPLPLDATQWGILAELVGAALERRGQAGAEPFDGTGWDPVRAAARTHDLRNQLTLALLEVERLRLEPEAEAIGGLERVLREAHSLCRSELEGRGEPASDRAGSLSALDLASWLPARVAQAARAARRGPAGPVPVEVESVPEVLADARLLGRAVGNLVTNALEAAGRDGHVRVRLRAVAHGDSRARAVCVAVEDDGPGLDADGVREAFRPGRSGAGGTGHGTSSVLEALELHGARLLFETAPGGGTCARLELPAAPDAGEPFELRVDDLCERSGFEPFEAGVLRVTGARAASAVLRARRPVRVRIARGLPSPERAALLGRCARAGVPLVVDAAGR